MNIYIYILGTTIPTDLTTTFVCLDFQWCTEGAIRSHGQHLGATWSFLIVNQLLSMIMWFKMYMYPQNIRFYRLSITFAFALPPFHFTPRASLYFLL